MKKKFKTPVAMKVTEEQYKKDLKDSLLKLGYKESSYTDNSDNAFYLINDLGLPGRLGFNQTVAGNHLIKNYNPELFLAIAAMTEGEDWIVGEWLYNEDLNKFFCYKKLKGGNSRLGHARNHLKDLYRKATVEELENHFKITSKKELKVGDKIKALYDDPDTLFDKVKKGDIGKIIKNNTQSYEVEFPNFKHYYIEKPFNTFRYELVPDKKENNSNIPDEFFVYPCDEFTEDIFNKLYEWASKNSKGKIRDYKDSYEFFIKNEPSIWKFNFCKENSTNNIGYGVDNHNWGNAVKTEYSLEQVKELIGYEEDVLTTKYLKKLHRYLYSNKFEGSEDLAEINKKLKVLSEGYEPDYLRGCQDILSKLLDENAVTIEKLKEVL